MSKVVFVGNVPYTMGEEQLMEVFKSVGQVIAFRLVYDRDTGKAKGYGFCEFSDHDTALSAVRNLNNIDVGGRPLRIDLADSDPFLEGKTTVRGELMDGGFPGPSERSGWRPSANRNLEDAILSSIPPGKPLPKGMSSSDAISEAIAAIPDPQIYELLAQTKAFIINHPDQARILLSKNPQLSCALFQAMVMHHIVPEEVVQKMHASLQQHDTRRPPPPGMHNPALSQAPLGRPQMVPPVVQQPHLGGGAYPPPHTMPPFPPGAAIQQQPIPGMAGPGAIPTPPPGSMYPPQAYYRPPVSAGPIVQPAAAPPVQPAAAALAAAGIDDNQRDMIMMVLSMNPDAINALPEAQRSSVMQLRNKFMALAPSN
ncbi:hypothetical protein FA15DRAFT_628616 [Coprinopsis marcescibilis]|uniref:RRM domain-containing protein n=1 Tax=Coprinopsis marcescibilis TaxID=230819 RepID=A0A5C3KCM8_COPMA|nr:hypothetical protein FA15DRAFT_628616 [Coprinopsis marcescibilis]